MVCVYCRRPSLSNNSGNSNKSNSGFPFTARRSSRRSTRFCDSLGPTQVSINHKNMTMFVPKRVGPVRIRLIVDAQLNSIYAQIWQLLASRQLSDVLNRSELIDDLFEQPIQLTSEMVNLVATTILTNICREEYIDDETIWTRVTKINPFFGVIFCFCNLKIHWVQKISLTSSQICFKYRARTS